MTERAVPSEVRLVRTLRHRFAMPLPLTEMVVGDLELPTSPERLRMFGTRQVILEGSDYYNYAFDGQITTLTNDFRANQAPTALNGEVRMQDINHGMARLAFQVVRQPRFDRLLSGFDTLQPRLGITAADKKNYLYIDVASPLTNQARARALGAMAERLHNPESGMLYGVTPLDIDGFDSEMRLLRRETHGMDPDWLLDLASNR